MGLISDILFGTDSSSTSSQSKKGSWMGSDDYDSYYEDCYDDAKSGDLDAQAEMREEFGDDWDEEGF